jgi:alpha-glucosidase
MHSSDTCEGSLYLDDGNSYDFKKGEYLRLHFTCAKTADGVTVKVGAREGTFAPWWNQFSVEVYGAEKPAARVTSDAGPVNASFDREHHHLTAVVPDDGKGMSLTVTY